MGAMPVRLRPLDGAPPAGSRQVRHRDDPAILDEALTCHVGFAVDGRPWVVPTAFARIGDHLYLHGAVGNFALRALAGGAEACITVTLLDGLVRPALRSTTP